MSSAEFIKIIQEYTALLPQKISELHTLTEQTITALGKNTQPEWASLEAAAHQLAGSTGTYGFTALSKKLAELEDALTTGQIQKLDSTKAAQRLQQWIQKVQALTFEATQSQGNTRKAA